MLKKYLVLVLLASQTYGMHYAQHWVFPGDLKSLKEAIDTDAPEKVLYHIESAKLGFINLQEDGGKYGRELFYYLLSHYKQQQEAAAWFMAIFKLAFGNIEPWEIELCLKAAVETNDLACCKFILDGRSDKGAIINLSETQSKLLPLSAAIELPTDEIARYLIENGADIEAFDFDGKPALAVAVKNNKTDLVKLLLSMKPNARAFFINNDRRWTTIAEYALDSENQEIVTLFKENGYTEANSFDADPILNAIARHVYSKLDK